MDSKKRKQTGVLVRGLFAILMDHPEGVAVDAAVERLSYAANGERTQLYEQLMRECVAPIKAGWLSGNSCHFILSEEGRVAFKNYPERMKWQLLPDNQPALIGATHTRMSC